MEAQKVTDPILENQLLDLEYLITILKIGASAAIQVTGLRNPCSQLDSIKTGLKQAVRDQDEEGYIIRKAGIMSIVLQGGDIFVGDENLIQLPNSPYEKLEKV